MLTPMKNIILTFYVVGVILILAIFPVPSISILLRKPINVHFPQSSHEDCRDHVPLDLYAKLKFIIASKTAIG